MVTFAVDNVIPDSEPLPTQPVGELYADALAIGGDPDTPVLVPDGVHPLLGAVARAFADHRPLVLSPDAIWLTITHGLAQHIRLHAEELRPMLVDHAGRRQLSITVDGQLPNTTEAWHDAVELFSKLLASEAHGAELFECDFTTSTEVERIAGKVVMLDAYSPYYALLLIFACGIPSITLTGTVEDWRKIRSRVESLKQFGLHMWCDSLRPIADHFVRAAEGNADKDFWQRVYNPIDAYGGRLVTGWITRFYPYLKQSGLADSPNPMLELPVGEPRNVPRADGSYRGLGIGSDRVPNTLSTVVVTVNDRIGGENRTVALHAGLVGVAHQDDGALRPIAGWYLAPAPIQIDDVIDRLIEEHETSPALPDHVDYCKPADLVAMDLRIGSAAVAGWRLRPRNDRPFVLLRQWSFMIAADLPDGRHLGYLIRGGQHWIACRVDGGTVLDDPQNVPVFGTSLAILLAAAMDFDGDISSLETGRLADL